MGRLVKLSVVSLTVLAYLVAGCGEPTPPPLHPAVLAKAGLQYYWQLPVTLDEGESIVYLEQIDENLYCLTDANRLIAVDAVKGMPKWSYVVGDRSATVFHPVHAKVRLAPRSGGIREILEPVPARKLQPVDVVLINTLSYVLVIDRSTGELRRKIPFDFAANTTGACDGTYFYVGSTKGWYYAIRVNEAVKEWWHSANDMITAPIEYFQGAVYVADDTGTIIATRTAAGGRKLWKQQLRGAVTARFHVDERGCFVASDDNRLYAFSLVDGRPLWKQPFVCEGPLRDPVQVGENTIFLFARRDKFYAINLVTGKQRWALPEGRKALAVMDGEAYVLSADNEMLIVDEMLGTIRTALPLTGWELFAGNTTKPAIYLASRSGRLACIRKLSAGRLTAEMLLGRKP